MEETTKISVEKMAAIIEAVLFVSGDPVSVDVLAKVTDSSAEEIEEAVQLLKYKLEKEDSGLEIVRFSDQVQLGTKAVFADYIDKLTEPGKKQTLSQSAIETLSIIAYRQPITKSEIENIRGVRSDYAVASLHNKGLIKEVGRKESLGRPILYGTTDLFLRHFSLEKLEDLPNREELLPEGMTV